MKYTCPVCGFSEMEDPPKRHNICNCCGTEFGNDDYFETIEQLRQKWIEGGMKWWGGEVLPPPSGWTAEGQLSNIRVGHR